MIGRSVSAAVASAQHWVGVERGPRKLTLSAWITVAAFACGRPSAEVTAPVFADLAPGLQHTAVNRLGEVSDTTVAAHVLRFSPQDYALRVVAPAQTGVPVADAEAFRVAADAVAAFNGGFFDSANAPLGLLVSGGRTLSPLRKVDHGVFAVAAGAASVRHASQWQEAVQAEFAVECGPRLLVDGAVPHFRSAEAARRTAIAIDAQGRVLVVVTVAPVSLDALAQWIRAPLARGGLGAVQALNLDGGKSTMLSVRTPAVRFAVASPVAVPVGIAVVARR